MKKSLLTTFALAAFSCTVHAQTKDTVHAQMPGYYHIVIGQILAVEAPHDSIKKYNDPRYEDKVLRLLGSKKNGNDMLYLFKPVDVGYTNVTLRDPSGIEIRISCEVTE